MADYADWALWAHNGLLAEDALPLSPATKDRVKAWLNAYDAPPRADWPLWSAPPGADEEHAWVAEGEALRELLQRELGRGCEVVLDV